MKALLVNPAMPDTLWSLKYVVKALRRKGFYPPLGLLTVASLMPEDWELRLIDTNVEDLRSESIEWADMVFVSAMVVQKESVRQIIESCRSANRPLVAGGPLFTGNPTEFDEIDHLVLNEAEITFREFLNDLALGEPQHVYSSSLRPDLTQTPVPRWDLVNIHDYISATVQCSRGCPFDCEFCDITHLYGRTSRVKSPDQMIEELEAVYSTDWRGRLLVCDDNFVGSKMQVKRVLEAVCAWQQARNYPFEFHTQASIDLASDQELLELMSAAGFEIVCLGLETPVQESLEETGKYHNCGKDMIAAIRKIQNHGIEVAGSFIVGFDSDPPDVFEKQIEFIQRSGIIVINLTLLNAFPGTRLYQRLGNEGRLLGLPTGDHTDGSMNFVPKLQPETLKRKYHQTLAFLYSPKAYYERILEFLKHFQPSRRKKIDLVFLLTVIASMICGGVLDGSRGKKYYWKTFLQTLLFHRATLWKVTANSVFGYHFRKQLKNRLRTAEQTDPQ